MSEEKKLSHVDVVGKVNMVNVSKKEITHRCAVAQAIVELPEEIITNLVQHNFHLPKGPVMQTAIIAGIMAAKKTGELIPLCHPLGLDAVDIDIQLDHNELVIISKASVHARTGVEMEVLTAVTVAALTVYDMCKAISHYIVIKEIKLMEKTGGRNDFKRES